MCSCQGAETKQFNISGGNDEGVPPVPIPNTEVKPFSAENTSLETGWKDKTLPDFHLKQHLQRCCFLFPQLAKIKSAGFPFKRVKKLTLFFQTVIWIR